jgi:hypothetical protein
VSQSRQEPEDTDAATYDETKWMAIAIELLVVVAAVLFAVLQSW